MQKRDWKKEMRKGIEAVVARFAEIASDLGLSGEITKTIAADLNRVNGDKSDEEDISTA